jgi:hypothetical protein
MPNQPHNKLITIKCNAAELAELRKICAFLDTPVSEFVRAAVKRRLWTNAQIYSEVKKLQQEDWEPNPKGKAKK